MSAGVRNFNVEQGSTFSISIQMKDSAGAAIDLTGYQGRGQVRYKAQDSAAAASFTVTVPDPSAGLVLVELTAAQSAGIVLTGDSYADKSTLYYDIELYMGEIVKRVLQGTLTMSPEITK